MVCKKKSSISKTFEFIAWLEMLLANDIVPRNPELFEPQEHTLHSTPVTSEMSTGKGESSKVKKEAKSRSVTDDDDSDDRIREKALLVRF